MDIFKELYHMVLLENNIIYPVLLENTKLLIPYSIPFNICQERKGII